jgi:hypothetical protein
MLRHRGSQLVLGVEGAEREPQMLGQVTAVGGPVLDCDAERCRVGRSQCAHREVIAFAFGEGAGNWWGLNEARRNCADAWPALSLSSDARHGWHDMATMPGSDAVRSDAR